MPAERFFTASDTEKYRILGTYIVAALAAALVFVVAASLLSLGVGTPGFAVGIAVKLAGTLILYTHQKQNEALPLAAQSTLKTAITVAVITEFAVLAALFYAARSFLQD